MADRNSYTTSNKALQTQRGPEAETRAHSAFLHARLDKISRWVTQGVRPEALIRFAMLDLSTNDKLRACTPDSIFVALLACAATGLEPGSLRGEAYLVPFAGRAQFMPGWRGLVKQARRSREVVGLHANVVRENDLFDLDEGTANSLVHKPARSNRGDVIGSYAIATMAGGHHEIEWLDREDLDRIRKVAESRGRSPAWKDWADQMERKSAIRRLAKRLPLGSDYYVALALEQAVDDGKDQKDVLDIVAASSENNASTDSGAQHAPVVEEPAFNPETMTEDS